MKPDSELIAIERLGFAWPRSPEVLDIAEFNMAAGETCFIHGPSGCGKSSFLGVIAGVLAASRGQVQVMGHDLARLRGAQRDALRARSMGVIFQQLNLLPFLDMLDNVLLPCRLSPERARAAIAAHGSLREAAAALLTRLGLAPTLWTRRADALSVGQQQRVAAARALIGGPRLVIADEPTSALDEDSRERFLDLLFELCAEHSAGLLFVSHERSLGRRFARQLDLRAINRASEAQPCS